MFLEDFKLCLEVLASVIFESLQDINEAITHEFIPEMDSEVEVIRTGDEGIDEGETRYAERLIVSNQ